MESDWRDFALCKGDPDAWFLQQGDDPRPVKRICRRCPVRPECLEEGLQYDEQFGIRAGLGRHGRNRLKPLWLAGMSTADIIAGLDAQEQEAAA